MTQPSTAKPTTDEPRVLTVEETGKILRVGKNTMYGLIADGSLASLKIGNRRLITRAALDAFLGDRPMFTGQ